VIGALIEQAKRLPDELRKSLTWDRGKEMAEHKRFTLATDAQVYFCDPQSHGSAARTRTPTASCANTSPRVPT
jgi:IS30 family transposase